MKRIKHAAVAATLTLGLAAGAVVAIDAAAQAAPHSSRDTTWGCPGC